jgi:uncharacterized protein (DUF924 family)
MVTTADLDAIHAYWFGAPEENRLDPAFWFHGSPEMDADIKRRFGAVLDEAATAAWDVAALTPAQRVGLVVLLDQFSRNVHRGDARTYENDALARQISRRVVAAGMDAMTPIEAMFAILPLGHSEALADQDEAVALFELHVKPRVPPEHGFWSYAGQRVLLYRDTIARFGRFPRRNALLGRPSTPEESAYLAAESGGG